jgi:quercetin dioxygenase-like cupin family protein
MNRTGQLFIAFAIGACAGTTHDIVAQPAPEPVPETQPNKIAAVVLSADQAQTQASPNGKASVRRYASGPNAFVAQIEIAGLAEIPPHRDPTEEYIVVLQGGGTLLIDGAAHQLAPGSSVFMPAGAEVSFANGPNTLVALQVFAGPESADKYAAWAASTDETPN